MQILALESATTHVSASLLRYLPETDPSTGRSADAGLAPAPASESASGASTGPASAHRRDPAAGSSTQVWQRAADLPRAASESLLELVDGVLADAGITLSEVDLLATSVGPGMFTGVRIAIATLQGLALARGCPVVGVDTLAAVALGVARAFAPSENGLEVAVLMDARRDEVYTAAYRFPPGENTGGHLCESTSGQPEYALDLAARLVPVASPALSQPGRAWATIAHALGYTQAHTQAHTQAKKAAQATSPHDASRLPRLAVGSGIGMYPGLEPAALSDAGASLVCATCHPEAENVALLAAVLALSGKTLAMTDLEPLYLRPAVD